MSVEGTTYVEKIQFCLYKNPQMEKLTRFCCPIAFIKRLHTGRNHICSLGLNKWMMTQNPLSWLLQCVPTIFFQQTQLRKCSRTTALLPQTDC